MRALINKLLTIAVIRLGTRAAIVTCPLSHDWRDFVVIRHIIIARRAICSTQLQLLYVEIKIRFDWKNFSGKENTFHSKNYALVYAPLPIFDRENVYFFFSISKLITLQTNFPTPLLLCYSIKI